MPDTAERNLLRPTLARTRGLMSNLFKRFDGSSEVIRYAAMVQTRYPLSLRNVEVCWSSTASISSFHEILRLWQNRVRCMRGRPSLAQS